MELTKEEILANKLNLLVSGIDKNLDSIEQRNIITNIVTKELDLDNSYLNFIDIINSIVNKLCKKHKIGILIHKRNSIYREDLFNFIYLEYYNGIDSNEILNILKTDYKLNENMYVIEVDGSIEFQLKDVLDDYINVVKDVK